MKYLIAFTLLCVLTANTTPLYAQSMADQAGLVLAGKGLPGVGSILPEGSLPMESIKAAVKKQGFTQITDTMMAPNGMLQASAFNADGILDNLQIDPSTGTVMSALAAH